MTFYGRPFNISVDNSNVKIQIIDFSGDNAEITVPITDDNGKYIGNVPWPIEADKWIDENVPQWTKTARKPHNPYGDSPYWSPMVRPPVNNPFTQDLPKDKPEGVYQPEIKKEEEPSNDHLEIF